MLYYYDALLWFDSRRYIFLMHAILTYFVHIVQFIQSLNVTNA